MLQTLILLLLLPLVQSSPLQEDAKLAVRAQCNADNVLRALQHRTPDSYAFCSSYISQPAATTVTITTSTYTYVETAYSVVTRHPAMLYNLQRLSSTQSPLKYASPTPKPSTVPGGACYYPSGGFCATSGPYKRTLEARATTTAESVPSYLATVPPSRISSGCSCLSPPYAATITTVTDAYTQVTVTCTTYYAAPVTTLPAFCAPTAQVNAPSVLAVSNLTTVKSFSVQDKLSCCASCANVFNCVWWKFNFGKPYANGSGDPWQAGSCTYAFNTGVYLNADTAICPNGEVNAIDSKYSYTGRQSSNNLPGYNHGACGSPVAQFQSSQDFGYPDGVYNNPDCPAGPY